jgi:hypothetical protein
MNIFNNFVNYATPWRLLNRFTGPQPSTCTRISLVILSTLGVLLLPLNIILNCTITRHLSPFVASIAERVAVVVQRPDQEDIEKALRALAIEHPQPLGTISFQETPAISFNLIPAVSPFKPLSVYTGNSDGMIFFNLPDADKQIWRNNRQALIDASLRRGNRHVQDKTLLYNPEAIFELITLNREKIIVESQRLGQTLDPQYFNYYYAFIQSVTENRSKDEQVDAFALFVRSNQNLYISNDLDKGVFSLLGRAAYGDIPLAFCDQIFLPKDFTDLITLRKEFEPQWRLSFIRQLLIHFEHHANRLDYVRAVLNRLPPLPEYDHYYILDGKLKIC